MFLKKLFVFILTFSLLSCLIACSNSEIKENNSSNTTPNTNLPRFIVTVTDQNGQPVDGVVLKMKSSSNIVANTKKDGIATFSLFVTSGYKLSVVHCPDGYEYKGRAIDIKPGSTEYTLEITKK